MTSKSEMKTKMGKVKLLRKVLSKKNVESEESDDDEFDLNVTRFNNAQIRAKMRDMSMSYCDDYDADSETDMRTESSVHTGQRLKRRKNKFALNKSIRECEVSLKDVLNVDSESVTESPSKKSKYTRLKNRTSFHQNYSKIDTSMSVDKSSPVKCKEIVKNKENVTPPDRHSNPTDFAKTSCNLEKTFLGFTDVEKEQDCDNEENNNDSYISHHSSSVLTTYSNESKRKRSTELTGFHDIPTTEPAKKKVKRKKNKKDKEEVENSQEVFWERLRLEFQEVEMHELVIE